MRIARIAVVVVLLLPGPAQASEPFKDVPKDHWAAGAVQKLRDEGVLLGYPDGTFRGSQPLTRYELAAALQRFVEFLQESEKPLSQQPPRGEELPRSRDLGQAQGTKQPGSTEDAAKEPVKLLIDGGFLQRNLIPAKDGRKPVTPEELADTLASVARRLIELRVPQGSGAAGHVEGNSVIPPE